MDLKPYGPAGRRLVEDIVEQLAEDGLTPDARDRALLDTAARLTDRMTSLEAMVKADGERSMNAAGVVRLHPGVAELRNYSIALSKVLVSVSMHETSGAAKDPAKVRAAATRWRPHNLAKAAAAAKQSDKGA